MDRELSKTLHQFLVKLLPPFLPTPAVEFQLIQQASLLGQDLGELCKVF